MAQKWMVWTVLEASTKTSTALIGKMIGTVSTTTGHTILATLIIGMVQMVFGILVSVIRKTNLFRDWHAIAGACLFGVFAVTATVLTFMAFMYGGDVGVITLIATLSIIPGAFIDLIFFRHRLSARQWFGILVAIIAGYSVLGWPSLQDVAALPLWIWCSLGMMLSVAINQGITQTVRRIDPFVKNFWGGLTTVILCALLLIVMDQFELVADLSLSMQKIWKVSLLSGLIVVGMWSFNLMSYKGGATIALKKLVMNGAYLSMAMLGGFLFFHEPLTLAKMVGVCLYCLAFIMWDPNTWTTTLFLSRVKVGHTQN